MLTSSTGAASISSRATTFSCARAWLMFETFLLAPERHLRRIERPRRVTVSSCGLLPAQRDVQRRLDLQEAFIEMVDCAVRAIRGESHCADGRWTEKLKHRTWPRHRGRRTTKEAT